MGAWTDYAENKITDAVWRGQSLGAPATVYFALITASKGTRANSTAYSLNDTIVVQVSSKYYFYKCTTAGTSNASLPGAYTGTAGEAITDGTAVFTEQSAALDAGTGQTEASGAGYARVGVTGSLANFAGTQGAGTTVASSGSSGTTSNNGTVTFGSPTASWQPTGGQIVGYTVYDASTSGNPWAWGMLSAPKTVNASDPAPSIAAGAWTFQVDN